MSSWCRFHFPIPSIWHYSCKNHLSQKAYRNLFPISLSFYSPIQFSTQTVLLCYIRMYRTLTDAKFLRRLSDRSIIFYNKLSHLHGSFFNIILQKNPLQTSFYNVCRESVFYSILPFNLCLLFFAGDIRSTHPILKVYILNTYKNSSVNCME